jgi:two-component system KDP operon response regulator KdpE
MSDRILIVEDDADLRASLGRSVAVGGFEHDGVECARDAVAALGSGRFAALLLDLGLPDMARDAVLPALRAVSDLPILVVSGNDSEQDRILALDQGADDFLPKPFLSGELLARIRAALRRYDARQRDGDPLESEAKSVRLGGLILDPHFQTASHGGRSVPLTVAEYRILAALIARRSAPVPKEALMAALYGPGEHRESKIVEVYLGRIRRKLETLTGRDDLIASRWGLGWVLTKID